MLMTHESHDLLLLHTHYGTYKYHIYNTRRALSFYHAAAPVKIAGQNVSTLHTF